MLKGVRWTEIAVVYLFRRRIIRLKGKEGSETDRQNWDDVRGREEKTSNFRKGGRW
jgi:hypothetical protein